MPNVIETRVNLQKDQQWRPLRIGLLHPTKSLVFSIQSGVNSSHKIGRYVSLLRKIAQLLEYLLSLVPISGRSIYFSEPGEEIWRAPPERESYSQRGNSRLIHGLILIRKPKVRMRWCKRVVQFDGPGKLCDGLI